MSQKNPTPRPLYAFFALIIAVCLPTAPAAAGAAGKPGAPTSVSARRGNQHAVVYFSPPVSDGGSPITNYTVVSHPGKISATGTGSPIVVTGLQNGGLYTFTVKAANAAGTGRASMVSNVVMPGHVPDAPTNVKAFPDRASAVVAFAAPASDGGYPVTGYRVTSNRAGVSVEGTASPIKVTGLTNGKSYTFRVAAINKAGTGPPSVPSNSVIPARVPTPPGGVLARAGDAWAAVTFKPPVSNGGGSIIGYTVTSNPGSRTASGAGSPLIVTGLNNGTPYTFTVTATNDRGTGPPSRPSNPVTPGNVPGAPVNVAAKAGNAMASVSFDPPASDGGSPITGYTALSSPGGFSSSGSGSPLKVSGLTNGTAYTFTVTASNAIGTGPASSPSNSVTPSASTSTAFPLKVSSDGRHLVDQNNTPFLVVGDAAWSLIAQLNDADVDTYLADRQSRGFNTIIVNLIEHKFATNAPADYYGDQPFKTPGDFSTPNEAYFAHADKVINQAAAYGMLVILAPAYMGYECDNEGWCQEMLQNGTAKCQSYGAYVGARYANFPNVLWMEGIDVNSANYNATGVMQAVVTGIKSADSNHLHTADCTRNSTAYNCYNYSWLDVNDIYTDCNNVANYTSQGYKQANKPVYFNEGVYEGEGASQQCLDTQMYIPVLGGAFGSVFGNDPVWDFGYGGGDWKSALGSQGAIAQSNFGAFFNSIPWYNLVPDYSHTVLTAGYGNLSDSSYVGCARTSDGKYIVAYLPSQTTVSIDMTGISSSGTVTAKWLKPSTAESATAGTYPNTGTVKFTPPSSGDWVLVLAGSS